MPLIAVTSQSPGEGKTGVAAAIARHYAYLGRPVTLAREATSADAGNSAVSDAAFFASLDFVPGTSAVPVPAHSALDPGGDSVVVFECSLETASGLSGATTVLVARQAAPAALPAGLEATAVVVTAIAPSALASLPAQVGGAPVVALVEDRTLAGFSVSEARAMLHADVLVEGDAGDPTCDYLVIAPIASDAGQPYFQRFPSKAVVVRFDKTDMHLAAMQADPACLVLTGGRRPSDYLFDAASAQGIPVLLSRTDTENTVIALEGIFDNTRFQGQRKLERMAGLLGASALFAALNA